MGAFGQFVICRKEKYLIQLYFYGSEYILTWLFRFMGNDSASDQWILKCNEEGTKKIVNFMKMAHKFW